MSFYQGRARSILHPTDFSQASEVAFAHALAVALVNQADLTILHVARNEDQEIPWHEFPSVRNTLERWGVLELGSRRRDVGKQTGINVEKRIAIGKNPVSAVVEMTEVDSFDLLVMGTSGGGWPTVFPRDPSSLAVAKQTQLPSLFVPEQAQSCVDLETGATSFSKVLIAVDRDPAIQAAIDRTVTMLQNLGGEQSQVTLLYVGNEADFPKLEIPKVNDIEWSMIFRSGTPPDEIINQAKETQADLIVMMTPVRKQFWDVITGSTVQNVLRNAPCPVFTMPS
ncbi:MAG: universal stress protein [Pirellulaceae bacterium]|nr:universal stress protein [Pirellulaceae bacterium]